MKWINRSNLKEVNEAFIDALKVQYGEEWDMAYLRQDTVFAVGGKECKWIGFPESLEELYRVTSMSREELADLIAQSRPDIVELFG
jgi:hypothetical protein